MYYVSTFHENESVLKVCWVCVWYIMYEVWTEIEPAHLSVAAEYFIQLYLVKIIKDSWSSRKLFTVR